MPSDDNAVPTPTLRAPLVEDGAEMWRLAERSGGLDLNTPYAYLLWCRDFAAASVLAELDGRAAGYVTGFVRPEADDTVFVWQVTVAPEARGHRLAGTMLDHLADRLAPAGVAYLEASVTPDNEASRRTFEGFAARRGAPVSRSPLFGAGDFPTPHDPEVLLRIGPYGASPPAP